jgi:hypothetical protein
MPPKSRPQRKRKLPQEFSPMRPEEEKELNEVLFVSLRKIPENGNVSEDDLEDVDNKEEDYKEEDYKEEDEEVEKEKDDYEIKWNDIRQPVTVNEFTHPSRPTSHDSIIW